MAIYKCNTPEGVRYINAGTKITALNHCVETSKQYSAEPVSAEDLAAAYETGAKVEKAA